MKGNKDEVYDFDGLVSSPLSWDILNTLLSINYINPMFDMFSGDSNPKQHLINFQK